MRREIDLRWSDIDSLGHVNHAAYLMLLDDCRAVLLEEHVPTLGDSYVVRHLSIDFDSELVRADSPITVEVNVAAVGRTSVTLDEVVTSKSGKVCARVSCVILAWNGAERAAREVTAAERDVLLRARSAGM